MAVQVVSSPSELNELQELWGALADAAGARHYVQPLWALAWWRHMGRGEPYVAIVESGGRLEALAPLYRERRFGVDTLRFLGSDLLGVSEVLVSPEREEAGVELWSFLLSQSRCLLELRHHRFAGRGIESLRRAENHAWRAQLGPLSPSVTFPGSWDDYWRSREARFRQGLERRRRLAEKEQLTVRVDIATRLEELHKILPDVTVVFDAAERAQPKLHFLEGIYRPFTIEMLERAAELSRLAVFVLYLGDRPAATSWTFRSERLISGGGSRFDPEFGRFAPGQLLWRSILEYAVTTGCTELDFGPGDEPYKREWSNGFYDTIDVTAFSSRATHVVHEARSVFGASRLLRRVLG